MVLPLDVILWRIRDVLAFREELPQKPIGILVGPALPWMVRSRKVERHTLQFLAELSMFREFLSAIWRDRKMRCPKSASHITLLTATAVLLAAFPPSKYRLFQSTNVTRHAFPCLPTTVSASR